MNIEIDDILTLDNNKKYTVLSMVEYKEVTYLLLSNVSDNKDAKILELNKEKGSLLEINDDKLYSILMNLFYKELIKELDN